MLKHKLTLLTMIATTYGLATAAGSPEVGYPSDYRSWRHLKSMIIQPGHPLEDPFGGIHHIYANQKAISGLKSGQYETGAAFVFDLLDYVEMNKTVVEAERKRIDVMQYDNEQFSETGGWGFDTFVGNSTTQRLEQDVVAACFTCHMSVKSSNYVFSRY